MYFSHLKFKHFDLKEKSVLIFNDFTYNYKSRAAE